MSCVSARTWASERGGEISDSEQVSSNCVLLRFFWLAQEVWDAQLLSTSPALEWAHLE